MKNKLLLSLLVSLFAVSAWAADVTIVENYSTVANAGIGNRPVKGELCGWQFTQVRLRTDSIIKGEKKYRACLLAITSNGIGQLQTTNLEGGIKSVKFDYARTGSNKINGNSMQLQVTAGDISHPSASWSENDLTATGYETYNESFECKSNAQLTIRNNSTETTSPLVSGTLYSKILVQNVIITPYLLYRQKEVTIGVKQQGYYNDELINNTGSEGTISYSSSVEGVATIDEYGVITPVSAGNTIITAEWSEGASTTYTLHVVDGIVAENFSKVKQTSQIASTEWNGDLFAWEVANVRRGVDDTLGINPRIQATALRTNTGSSLVTKEVVEGGVKHVTFDWRQWASGTTPLTIDMYYSADKENWGEAVAKQSVEAVGAAEPHVFNEDIDNGAKGNAYLKLNYTSTKGVAVLGALKITPWLLYTTKEATLDTRGSGAMSYENTGLINNTGEEVTYSITDYDDIPDDKISIDGGTVSVTDRNQTGDITVQAKWSEVTTTYTLHVIGKADPNASFAESEKNVDRTILVFSNTLSKADGSGDVSYESSNENVAVVGETTGSITINGVGTTIIKATIAENDNFQGAVVSYTLNVTATTMASYPQKNVHVGLGGSIDNTLVYTVGYKGTISYNSSNPDVATVADNGVVSLAGSVGKTTITATLPACGGYSATSASYNLYVRDKEARKEGFKDISGVGVIEDSDDFDEWKGDLYTWERQYQVRRTNHDTIHAGADKHQATSIGIKTAEPIASSILRSKGEIEGGIKYLSFYWAQWGAAQSNTIRRIAVYAGEDLIGADELPAGSKSGDESMLAINSAIKANKQLIIKNESYQGSVGTLSTATNNSRIVMDSIYITPWLLYTDKSGQSIRIGERYTRVPDINNTDGETGELSYISSNKNVATVNSDGQVAAVSEGDAIITAKFAWSEDVYVTTTYRVKVVPVQCETFDGIIQTTNYQNGKPRVGDKATWTTSLGGFNTGDFGEYTVNLARFRAPYQDSEEEAYIYSSPIAGGISSLRFRWNIGGSETTTNWDIRVLINGRQVKKLQTADLATRTQAEFGTIDISDIDEPGNFVIRFENHSTIGEDYTENARGRFLIDDVSWVSNGAPIVLNENADNSAVLAVNSGSTQDVQITRAALKGDVWNTLCLPFEINVSDLREGVDVQDLYGVEQDGVDLIFGFKPITEDVLEAGHPYLVKPAEDVTLTGFGDRTIVATPMTLTRGDYALVGVFSPLTLTNDGKTLFVGPYVENKGNLYFPSASGNTIKGFRAYFKKVGGPTAAPKRVRYVVNYNNTATDIEAVMNEGGQVRGVQKIIRDGQLFIIRDERIYNAQGILVK